MTFTMTETDGGYVKITGKRDGEKIGKLVVLEQELPELIETIKQYQNPMFVKGDIVVLTGKDWSAMGWQYTNQVVTYNKTFEGLDGQDYEIYRNETEDFSARLIGRVIE